MEIVRPTGFLFLAQSSLYAYFLLNLRLVFATKTRMCNMDFSGTSSLRASVSFQMQLGRCLGILCFILTWNLFQVSPPPNTTIK